MKDVDGRWRVFRPTASKKNENAFSFLAVVGTVGTDNKCWDVDSFIQKSVPLLDE